MKRTMLQILFWILWLLIQATLNDNSQLLKDVRQVQQLLENHVAAEESSR